MNKAIFISLFFSISLIIVSCQPEEDVIETADVRDNIVDTWRLSENSKYSGETAYAIDIIKDPSTTNKIIISNFYNLGNDFEVLASVSGSLITISSQTISNTLISGTGNVKSGYQSIDWAYNADDGSHQVDSVTASSVRF